ncbi:MAG: YcgN family cysteine cluster protein [Gammaproteobacteria bacterium]
MSVLEKPLYQLSTKEWESLCDGCGRCCLIKFEDEDTGKYFYTNIVCELWDQKTGRCQDYANRQRRVPDCLDLKQQRDISFLPNSCAYRLRAQGKALPEWHPLVSGERASVAEAGISIIGKVISEEYVHRQQYLDHIIEWIEVD